MEFILSTSVEDCFIDWTWELSARSVYSGTCGIPL